MIYFCPLNSKIISALSKICSEVWEKMVDFITLQIMLMIMKINRNSSWIGIRNRVERWESLRHPEAYRKSWCNIWMNMNNKSFKGNHSLMPLKGQHDYIFWWIVIPINPMKCSRDYHQNSVFPQRTCRLSHDFDLFRIVLFKKRLIIFGFLTLLFLWWFCDSRE